MYDDESDILLGASNLRHYLTDEGLKFWDIFVMKLDHLKEEKIWAKIISTNEISRRKSAGRCKICTKSVHDKRIDRKKWKILLIYGNRWIYKVSDETTKMA